MCVWGGGVIMINCCKVYSWRHFRCYRSGFEVFCFWVVSNGSCSLLHLIWKWHRNKDQHACDGFWNDLKSIPFPNQNLTHSELITSNQKSLWINLSMHGRWDYTQPHACGSEMAIVQRYSTRFFTWLWRCFVDLRLWQNSLMVWATAWREERI